MLFGVWLCAGVTISGACVGVPDISKCLLQRLRPLLGGGVSSRGYRWTLCNKGAPPNSGGRPLYMGSREAYDPDIERWVSVWPFERVIVIRVSPL